MTTTDTGWGKCNVCKKPIAFGATLGLNPLVVLIVTIGAGALFGMVGLVLAAPLTSAAVHISADLARAKAAVLARQAERQRDRGGGRVRDLGQVIGDLGRVELEPLADRLDDPRVRLVVDEQVDVVELDPGGGDGEDRRLRQPLDGAWLPYGNCQLCVA